MNLHCYTCNKIVPVINMRLDYISPDTPIRIGNCAMCGQGGISQILSKAKIKEMRERARINILDTGLEALVDKSEVLPNSVVAAIGKNWVKDLNTGKCYKIALKDGRVIVAGIRKPNFKTARHRIKILCQNCGLNVMTRANCTNTKWCKECKRLKKIRASVRYHKRLAKKSGRKDMRLKENRKGLHWKQRESINNRASR